MRAILQTASGGYDALQQRDASGGIEIRPQPVNLYRAEVEEFGRAVLEGRDPLVGMTAGIRSQQLIEACYRSASTGSAVDVAQ